MWSTHLRLQRLIAIAEIKPAVVGLWADIFHPVARSLRRICEQHVPEPLECDNTDKTVALQSSCGFDGFDEHSTLSLAVHWPARNSCSWFFCMSLSLLSLSFAQAIQIQVFGVLGYEWSLGYGYKNGFASLQKHTLSRFAYLSTMSNHVFSRYGYSFCWPYETSPILLHLRDWKRCCLIGDVATSHLGHRAVAMRGSCQPSMTAVCWPIRCCATSPESLVADCLKCSCKECTAGMTRNNDCNFSLRPSWDVDWTLRLPSCPSPSISIASS